MNIEQLNSKYNNEFTNKLFENKHIFYEILNECKTFNRGIGSYLFDGQTYDYCDKMYEKQLLLFNQVKTAKKILEIGVYMGHSIFIMLLSNPELEITCIDIEDTLTRPAVNLLNKYFNNRIKFIHSDSLSALQNLNDKYDFFHIDGHHENNYITLEFFYLMKRNNGNIIRIIFDDQDSLQQLISTIDKDYKVCKKIIPNSAWTNIYYEIDLTN